MKANSSIPTSFSRAPLPRFGSALAFLGAGLLSLTASATQLRLVPDFATVTPGSSIDLTLEISGLGDASAPSLGAFDLDVAFDPGFLTYVSHNFGDPALGDLLGPVVGSVSGSNLDATAGILNLFSLSLDLASDLDNLQPGQFSLATLRFLVTGTGSTTIDLVNVVLGDADGAALDAEPPLGAVIRSSLPSSVPDQGMMAPAAVLLTLAAGFSRWRTTTAPQPTA